MQFRNVAKSNKHILGILLAFVMLLAMMPASVSEAHAASPTANTTESIITGSVLVEYRDFLTGEELAAATSIAYDDMDEGMYSISAPAITGYTYSSLYAFNGTASSATKASGQWKVANSPDGTLADANSWAKYRVYYTNNKAENGYIAFERYVGGTQMSRTILYADDFDQNGIRVDISMAGYTPTRLVYNVYGQDDYIWYRDAQPLSGSVDPLGSNATHGYLPQSSLIPGTTAGSLRIIYEVNRSMSIVNVALLVHESASIPNVTIPLTITGIQSDIPAVPGTSLGVMAPTAANGVSGSPTVGSAVFSPSDSTVTSAAGVTIPANKKADIKSVTADFSNVTFAQPGVFRYIISEPNSGYGLTYDTQMLDPTNGARYSRVLDVYVVRNASNEYVIDGIVMHETSAAPLESAANASDKSPGFVNEYSTLNLTVESHVSGNQASIEKYFAYTVVITNPGGSEFSVSADWSGGSTNPTGNPSTSYTSEVMTAANTAEWESNGEGVLTHTFYLQDGQEVEISGIPENATYSVTSVPEDYLPSWDIEASGSDTVSGETEGTGNKTLSAPTEVIFTMTREGFVPTGVALSILPGVIIAAVAFGFILVMRKRKKEEDEEE